MRLDVPAPDGSLVRLKPFLMSHAPDLRTAVEEARSSYGFTLVPRAGEVEGYLQAQFAGQSDRLTPFAQVRFGTGER